MTATLPAMGRPKKAEQTEPIRLPQSVVKRIRRIAAHRDQDPGDYVAERFGALLAEDERAMVEQMNKELGSATEKPAKPKK